MFTFAGSTHSKYTTYLLEFLTNLELECSRELRETTLNAMLVNLSGNAGSFSPGDLIQEFFNRLLEAVIERKGADFGDTFIRKVISRNLHHMGRVKKDLREGVGLAARAGHHSDPHMWPEVRILLKQYSLHELHSRRPGRSIDEEDVDDFHRGWERLAKGKLKRWVSDTISGRRGSKGKGTDITPDVTPELAEEGSSSDVDVDGDDNDDNDDDDKAGEEIARPTFGSMHMVDGEFVIETADFEGTICDYLSMLDDEHNDELGSDESTEEEVSDDGN